MGIVPVPPWYLSVGERGTDHELGEQTYKARWPNECLAEGEEQAAMMVDREREEQSSPIARGVIIYLCVPARVQHPTIPVRGYVSVCTPPYLCLDDEVPTNV